MDGKTFHHHYHILYDIPIKVNGTYVEIGCFAGASACLMLQKPNIKVVSIDLGNPIPEELVLRNIEKFNVHKNVYAYLRGSSQTPEMVNRLKTVTQEIDILFIDGDHSRKGVITDFNLYQHLVLPGGFIVFDDYNDSEFSPEVKPAVDFIVQNLQGFEIIGAPPNTFGARPAEMKMGNCFIIRKIA